LHTSKSPKFVVLLPKIVLTWHELVGARINAPILWLAFDWWSSARRKLWAFTTLISTSFWEQKKPFDDWWTPTSSTKLHFVDFKNDYKI